MFSLIKKLIPGFIKSLFWQTYLRFKFHSKNKFGKGVCFAKDLVMGKNCRIGSNVIIGRAVKLGNNVSIGKDAFIENIEIGDYTSIEGRVICTGCGNGKIKIGRNSYIDIYNVLDSLN